MTEISSVVCIIAGYITVISAMCKAVEFILRLVKGKK